MCTSNCNNSKKREGDIKNHNAPIKPWTDKESILIQNFRESLLIILTSCHFVIHFFAGLSIFFNWEADVDLTGFPVTTLNSCRPTYPKLNPMAYVNIMWPSRFTCQTQLISPVNTDLCAERAYIGSNLVTNCEHRAILEHKNTLVFIKSCFNA